MVLETLAPILQSPLRKAEPLNLTTRHLGAVLLATHKNGDPRAIQTRKRSYTLNQLMSLVQAKFTPNEKLPEWAAAIATAYDKELVDQHKRLVWYTFLVITREFRHLHNPSTLLSNSAYPKELKEFHGKIQDSTSEAHLNKWLEVMPSIPLDVYCDALTRQFDTGSYGGGYGGPNWGNIARTMYRYVSGATSAETFIDTAYTLAHNNGPMFNKNMFYGMYSGAFLSLLDIQRSGQMCEGLREGVIQTMTTVVGASELIQMVDNAQRETSKVGDHIDWYKVDAWRPEKDKQANPHKYAAQKAAQDKKYGKVPTKTLVDGKVVKIKAEFEVYPGQKVEVYERVAA
jgi:hypothetical protein